MSGQLDKTGMEYEIVTAIDARDLNASDPRIDRRMAALPGSMLSLVACALSHQRVYRKFLTDGQDAALVLEDDITVPTDLAELAGAIGASLTGAEVVLLNYDSRDPVLVSGSGMTKLTAGRALALPLDVGQPASGAAYIISRQACQRMMLRVPPIRCRADDWGHFFGMKVLDRVRCVVPLTVLKSPEFESTLGYNDPTSLKSRLLRVVERHDLGILHRAVIHRRSRIFKKWTRVQIVAEDFISKPTRLP